MANLAKSGIIVTIITILLGGSLHQVDSDVIRCMYGISPLENFFQMLISHFTWLLKL